MEPTQEPSLSFGEQSKEYIKIGTQMLGAPSCMNSDKEPLPRELLIPRLPPDIHNIVTNIIKSKPNVIPVLKKTVDEAIVTSQMFMNVAYSELEFIVWFSKRQFGFNELYMNDRRQLLRNSFLAMQLVRLSFRSKESAKEKILFAKDLDLSAEEALNISQFPPTIINMNLELIDWFHSLKLDEVECGLLQTIILASDDADNLMDRPLVRRIQNNHLEALRAYSNIRFPHAPHRLASLLLRLPFVRKMALLCMEHFLLLIESGQLTMDQLAVELVTSESQE